MRGIDLTKPTEVFGKPILLTLIAHFDPDGAGDGKGHQHLNTAVQPLPSRPR